MREPKIVPRMRSLRNGSPWPAALVMCEPKFVKPRMRSLRNGSPWQAALVICEPKFVEPRMRSLRSGSPWQTAPNRHVGIGVGRVHDFGGGWSAQERWMAKPTLSSKARGHPCPLTAKLSQGRVLQHSQPNKALG